MKGKLILVGAVAAALLLSSGVGNASCSGVSCSESTTTTIEPILTRSNQAKIDSSNSPAPNKIQNLNLKSFSLSASAGKLTAVATVQGALVNNLTDSLQMAPYSGQHVLILFQTEEFEDDAEVTGQDATGADVTWGVGAYNEDAFRWFLYYGWNSSEQRELCGLGYYDPTGELLPPAPVFFGQTFFVIGQPSDVTAATVNTVCTVTPDKKTIIIEQPYTYKYMDRTGLLQRQKEIVHAGQSVSNASAFTWADHEIGGPDPIGLIIGWTWYTDSLPTSGYDIGVIAGDPNPNRFAGPDCITNATGDPIAGNGGPDTGLIPDPHPCTIANPVGAGFRDTHLNLVAG